MDRTISQLSDRDAIAVLARLPEVRQAKGEPEPDFPEDERNALAQHFGVQLDAASPSEGELARQTLELLADDPAQAKIIRTMAENLPSTAQRFDGGLTIAIGTAALVVLQTYVHVKRDANGKWTFEMKKQPTDSGILKLFLQRLVPFLSGK